MCHNLIDRSGYLYKTTDYTRLRFNTEGENGCAEHSSYLIILNFGKKSLEVKRRIMYPRKPCKGLCVISWL